MLTACVGLGGNLGDAARTLASAVRDLRLLPQTRLLALSSLYTSHPLGPAGQPDYHNAIACLATGLTPHALLAALQAIEDRHGRVRHERWGARTLDLDLLLYGNDIVATADLVVPHPELENRNFVVIPLLETRPDLRLPDGRLLSSLPAAANDTGLSLCQPGPSWGD